MKIYYDLHIHTALSPCGDADMTPNNIVNMASLKELDCIAVTDHNTCGNARAVIEAAQRINPGLIVIPGMEAETSEEIHTVCLFPDCDSADSFNRHIRANFNEIDNEPHIFGEQIYYNENDEQVGIEKKLLLTATKLDLYAMVADAASFGGICIPAHVDRTSYSVLSSLGFIPPDLSINLIEISKNSDPIQFMFDSKRLLVRKFPFLQSSDAHYLWDISEKNRFLELDTQAASPADIINHLKNM